MEEQDESNLGKLIYRKSDLDYEKIFSLKKNKELEKYYNVEDYEGNNYFSIQDFNREFFDYFFYQPITIQYNFANDKDNNNQKTFNNIYSTEQIEKYNTNMNVNNPHIVFKDNKIDYEQAKLDIFNYVNKNNILIITNENDNEDNNFIFDDSIIKDYKFEKEKLSKYFNNYFVYNKKQENNFEYDQTKSRVSLISQYIYKFIYNQNLRFFKFCGPSSTGKSTTLLKFSREQRGIVYLNLKAIYEFYKNHRLKECYNLITYELRRLYFSDEDKKKSFKILLKEKCRNKNPWEIILNVIKFIQETSNVIIFDQFKKAYLSGNIYSQIEDYIKSSKLKLIICSAINNKDIRDEVIKTIERYKGNPIKLDDESQNYYFYFWTIFFNKKVEKDEKLNPLFELFDYKPKYKYLLLNATNINDCITEIKLRITEKIEEFFIYEKDFDMCKILLHIKNNINLKLSYDNDSDMNLLKKLPLKYFIIRLYSNYFQIDYAFKFIKYFQKEIITREDCNNYFKLKKYKTDKSLDGKVKGEYFEMSARFYIKENDVLPVKIDNILNVNNIVGLDPLLGEETLDNIINNINLTFKDDSFDSTKKEDNIKIVNNLLNEENITTQEDLEKKYCFKNLNYYYGNALLKYFFIIKKKEEKNELKKGKNKKKTNINEVEDEEEKSEENKDNNERKKGKKKQKSKKIEKSEKEDESEMKILTKKTKRDKKIENINKNNILIEQEQVNGKTLDQAFIYSNENKQIFIGFQMKCLSNKTNHSTTLKGITKENIKNNCQSILLRAKLDLGINIEEWHYFIIAYYNDNDIDNEFCRQLHKHCKNQDIPIIYYNPENPCFYINNININKFEKLDRILPSNLSNLDYDFPLSNSYNLFDNNFTDNLINSYYKQRMTRILNIQNFYKDEKELENNFTSWLMNYNLKVEKVKESIEAYFKIKKLKLIEYYYFDVDMTFPIPSENHMFLFVKCEKNNLIGLLNKKALEAKDLGTGEKLRVIDLPKFIDTNGEFYVFMVE